LTPLTYTPNNATTEFVTTTQGRIRLIVRRASPVDPWVVLAPGQGDSAESLCGLFESETTEPLNLAVFDPLGHGQSDDPPVDYSSASQGMVWRSVLDHLRAARAYIGGYSYGAYSAGMCSAALADRLSGLILIEGGYLTLSQKGETAESETAAIVEGMRTFHFDSWAAARAAIQSQTPTPWSALDDAEFHAAFVEAEGAVVPRVTEDTIRLMELALAAYSPSVLDSVTCPVLLLHATLPPERASMRAQGLAEFRRHARQTRMVPIPNAGHTIKEHLLFVLEHIAAFVRDRG
jgi:pimeloyl-ACP methyl ester carboxylesterase